MDVVISGSDGGNGGRQLSGPGLHRGSSCKLLAPPKDLTLCLRLEVLELASELEV